MNGLYPMLTQLPQPLATAARQKKIRKLFTPEEDALLRRIMFEQTFTTWIAVAAQIPGRSARQCRDRWANYLSPENKNGPWTQDEDRLLTEKFLELGPQWTSIAKFFDGRSENNVKNRWYTHLRGKYSKTPEPQSKQMDWMKAKQGSDSEAPAPKRPLLPPISTLESVAPLVIQSSPQVFQTFKLKSASAQPFASYRPSGIF